MGPRDGEGGRQAGREREERERERHEPELSFSSVLCSCDTSLEANDFYSNLNNNVKLSFQMFSLARNKKFILTPITLYPISTPQYIQCSDCQNFWDGQCYLREACHAQGQCWVCSTSPWEHCTSKQYSKYFNSAFFKNFNAQTTIHACSTIINFTIIMMIAWMMVWHWKRTRSYSSV